ncbi:hypothetical protein [Mycolicibacterium sp.]|uniref:hypothetical protein n=1 Tax=Mycolicibacterium sp. TaxID=2320850 RepID=UPI0028AB3D92|nr:hypothetical protein [Mycolicibacterium sp.]
MPDTPEDPVDHTRTSRRFTGETMKNTRTTPGLALVAVAVLALAGALYLLAVGHMAGAALAAGIATALGAAGAAWIRAEHHRVVRHEERWLTAHPQVPPDPPAG